MRYTICETMNSHSHRNPHRRFFVSIACIFSLMFSIMVHANGYDLPITQWPVDFREENAGVFYAYIAEANFINSMPDTFIYGWLGIFTAPPQYGVEGSGRFTQVGIKSENGQIFWEMESERPILNCLRNSTPFSTNGVYLKGCRGQANEVGLLR